MESKKGLPNHLRQEIGFIGQTLSEPNQYSLRYVAFLDVLGFKEIIRSNNSEWVKTNIYDEARRMDILFKTGLYSRVLPETSYRELEFVFISDSFIISIPTTVERSLEVLIVSCLLLQQFFIKAKRPILLRGGISKGEFYHFKEITFGPALVDAYLLEKNKSIYPRIVIDEALQVPELCTGKDNFARVCCSVDQDGQQYIDYLKMIVAFQKEDCGDLLRIRDFISNGVRIFAHDERTLDKYKWLAIRFNSALEFFYRDSYPARIEKYAVPM